ncbi:MAG: hypothetical protein WBA51_05635 [Erythrobacter sp.]
MAALKSRSDRNPVTGLAAYGGLFSSALIAATILPAQSEIVLAALLRDLPPETSLTLM